jgi:hypothetical protein
MSKLSVNIDYLDLRDRIDRGEPHVELLTRRQTAAFLTACGYPTAKATLDVLCMKNIGPPVACTWGQNSMSRPAEALAWARARARAAKQRPKRQASPASAEAGR